MSSNLYNEIKKYADGEITSQGLRKLLDTDDKSLRQALQQLWEETPEDATIDDTLKKEMLLKIEKETSLTSITPKKPAQSSNLNSQSTKLKLLAAAVAAILIIGGAAVWYRQYTKVTPPVITAEVRSAMTRSKAANLDEVEATSLRAQAGQTIAKQLSRYCHDERVVERFSEATQLSTHTDKEGWVTLDDGTLVHLNSDSRIFFPGHFGRGSRDIILDGEAYFMVATDRSRPFIVHTAYGDIKEYGTEFNVSARNGSNAAEVVLVSGSIGVTPTGGQERMMQPGTLCRMSATECGLSLADTEPYRAWNTGKVEFHDWTLERLMRVICRWYGCKAEYAHDSLKTERLSGMFDRYDSPATTLQALQTAIGLRFETEGGTITITP